MKNVILILILTCSIFAQKNKYGAKNAIDFHPLNLASGFSIGYERLLTEKLAIQLEGSKFIWDLSGQNSKGHRFSLFLPIHSTKKAGHGGLHSAFFAPFVKYESSSLEVSGEKWSIDNAVNIGVSGGRRWIRDSGLTFALRAGYGVFAVFNDSWTELDSYDASDSLNKGEKNTIEGLSKLLGGLELTFKVGIAF